MNADLAMKMIVDELNSAVVKFKPFSSPHEGYAVILEELDELWDDIKKNKSPEELRCEAKQVAAMAMRFLVDCCVAGPRD